MGGLLRTVHFGPRTGRARRSRPIRRAANVHAPAGRASASCPALIRSRQVHAPAGRVQAAPAAPRGGQHAAPGVVHQSEQAGLDLGVHARRDKAGLQSQRALPSWRSRATSRSVVVALSRLFLDHGARPVPRTPAIVPADQAARRPAHRLRRCFARRAIDTTAGSFPASRSNADADHGGKLRHAERRRTRRSGLT